MIKTWIVEYLKKQSDLSRIRHCLAAHHPYKTMQGKRQELTKNYRDTDHTTSVEI